MYEEVFLNKRSQVFLHHWYKESLKTTRILRGSFFGFLFGLFGQWAVTINQTIHLTPAFHHDINNSSIGMGVIAHELFHVEQQREMGFGKFLWQYILNWRPRHIRDGKAHPLEILAYERQDRAQEMYQIIHHA